VASVEFREVEKVYPGGTRALAPLSLQVHDGELLVFVGPSGCGKSTVLRLLAGLEAPTAGTLWIGDAPVNDLSPQARNVAMVFQDYALYPYLSVRGNLEFPLKMRRLPRAETERRVAWAAGVLGMEGWLDRLPRQLSGGQRQRVAMGRALVREPSVFLLDEPLSNLDARTRGHVREEIADLQRRTGTTMIYVTHDQSEAMTLGQRVAVLNAGQLQQLGSAREIYERPANAFVAGFVGNPPMNLFPTRLARDPAGAIRMMIGEQDVPIAPAHLPRTALERRLGESLTGGLRPEAFHLSETPGADDVGVTVEHVEYLGHETLLHARAPGPGPDGGQPLVVRLTGMRGVTQGEQLRLALDTARVHLFEAGGRALQEPP
jgi:multiple sugar transport system ATP-binding protein